MKKPYNAETIFPWSLVDEVIDILEQKEFAFSIYADAPIDPPRHINNPTVRRLHDTYRYTKEFAKYKANSTNWLIIHWYLFWHIGVGRGLPPKYRPHVQSMIRMMAPPKNAGMVFLHHDADRQAYKTIDMMKKEADKHVVSSAFFFRNRNMWDEDKEPYKLDNQTLKKLEADGFEVGYHLNAYELADYDLEKATQIAKEDVAWFENQFNLRGIVSHGGVPSKDGRNNMNFPYTGFLRKYIWYYDGRGFFKDKGWSDGNVYTTVLEDPRQVAKNAKQGERIMFLMHPQYYGDKLMDGWEKLPISKEQWWRDLWNLD